MHALAVRAVNQQIIAMGQLQFDHYIQIHIVYRNALYTYMLHAYSKYSIIYRAPSEMYGRRRAAALDKTHKPSEPVRGLSTRRLSLLLSPWTNILLYSVPDVNTYKPATTVRAKRACQNAFRIRTYSAECITCLEFHLQSSLLLQ